MAVDAAHAKSLFLHASELADPRERATYLEGECGADAELRTRVDTLLQINEGSPLPPHGWQDATVESRTGRPDLAATGALTPTVEMSRPNQGPSAEYRANLVAGTVISNRYALQEKIGEGGMGEVWVAKQTEPVKRDVALKLIKIGMDSRAVLQRFEQERQALAMMDHPNIAKVLDAGLTSTGQPFFVMELVKGLPLTKFCDQVRLSTRDRLELFIPICQAVQHAHQKGIVHRDLKPANILVTMIDGKPVPKVIDFGVAKATTGKLTDESMATQIGALIGTLEYMSPEQAGLSGEDVDTRADIYSLGVILYELLTGLRPIDANRLKKAAFTETIRIIREEDPSKPSTRLSTDAALPATAASHQTEPRRLMALLRGELDWVVMKCLEKNRDRRYDTANGLAKDIERYLADEPVEARPATARYRLSKFLHRNKGLVVASTVVLLAILGGLSAVLAVQAKANADLAAKNKELAVAQAKVQERFNLATGAIKLFEGEVGNDLVLKEDQFKPLRDRLLRGATGFYGKLEALLKDQPDRASRKALGDAYFQLAELTEKISDQAAALAIHRNALAVRRELTSEPNADEEARLDVPRSLKAVGLLQRATGDSPGAVASLEEAVRLAQEAESRNGKSELAQRVAGMAHHYYGAILDNTGKDAGALDAYKKALFLRQKLADSNPDVPEIQSELANTYNNIALVQNDLGQHAEAMDSYRRAIAIHQRLINTNPSVTEFQQDLARTYHNLGLLQAKLNKTDESLESARPALEIQQKLAETNPSVTGFQRAVALSHGNIGQRLSTMGDKTGALNAIEKAAEIQRKLIDANPTVTHFQQDLSTTLGAIGVKLAELGDKAGARAAMGKGLALKQKLVEANPSAIAFRAELARDVINFAEYLRKEKIPAESRDEYDRAVALLEAMVKDYPKNPEYPTYLAYALRGRGLARLDLGDAPGAAADTRRSLAMWDGMKQRAGWEWFQTACCHATFSALAGRAGSEINPTEASVEADQAMVQIRQAIAMGFRDLTEMRDETALNSLRARDDFKKLMEELAQPKKPAAKP